MFRPHLNKFIKSLAQPRSSNHALLAILFISGLNACGGSSNSGTPQLPNSGNTSPAPGSTGGSTGGSTSTPAPTVTVTPTTTPSTTPISTDVSTLTYAFTLGGTGSTTSSYTTPAITTDTRLRVKVIGGPASNITIETPGKYNGTYSNYTASYSCITYKLTVAGQSTVTSMIKVGSDGTGLCNDSAGEQVIDFSGRLSPGHGTVTVQVSEPKYDYYCKLYLTGWIYGSYYNFCPLYSVYKNHRVTGSLEVEVNGSSL